MVLEREAVSVLLTLDPALQDTAPGIAVTVSLGEPPVLVDGCVILDLSFTRGAGSDAGVVTTVDAGQGTLRLLDPGRLFDPTNDAAIAAIGTPIAIDIAGAPAFRGIIDDLAHDLEVATVALVDRVVRLAAVEFTETSVPAETASARVTRILDLASWPAANRDITAGGVALQAGSVARDAWSELVAVTRNELGALWVRGDGRLAWRPRAAAWAGGAPVLTFGCKPSDAYMASLTMRADSGAMVNVLSAARRTGTQRTVTDSASLARYGRRSHVQNDLELAADGDRDIWQDFYLRRQATPAMGVHDFVTRPPASVVVAMLGMEFGAIVQIRHEHAGPVIDRPARWLGSRWSVSPSYLEVQVITGEDASIRTVDRSTVIDTPAEWTAAAGSAADEINTAYREPGVAPLGLPVC